MPVLLAIRASSDLEEPTQYQCRHIKPDGRRCGSPSLRGEHFCYYHHTGRRAGPRQPQVNTATARKSSTFQLPSPADLAEPSGIALALGLILHKIAHNEIDPRRAGLLLYGLQIAGMNLRQDRTHAARETPCLDDITFDSELGPLAPEAELGSDEPKSVIQQLIEDIESRPGLIIQAVAVTQGPRLTLAPTRL